MELTVEATTFLHRLDKPVAVVTIAGMYRTGKSYLMNKFIRSKSTQGFKVGSTTTSVTKGLILWGKPLLAIDQFGRQFYYLVIDSEGLGSSQQDFHYDCMLMTLIFMLSSVVVYNSVGAIDQQALDNLQMVCSLSNAFKHDQHWKPKLIWVLRDFSLQLVNKQGQQISSQQYLQQCLEQIVPAISLQVKRKNEIRRNLKQNTRQQKCYTLVRPTFNEQQLVNISKCNLRAQFIQQVDQLRDDVFSGQAKDVKTFHQISNNQSVCMNGSTLYISFLEALNQLNSGQIPSPAHIWQVVASQRNQNLVQQSIIYLKTQLQLINLPVNPNQLKKTLYSLTKSIQNKLQLNLTQQSIQKYIKIFLTQAKSFNRQIQQQNQNILKQKCLKNVRDTMQKKLNLQQINPCKISQIKIIVQSLGLKTMKQIQAYEFVLDFIWDALYIAQQKAVLMQRQLDNALQTNLQQTNGKKYQEQSFYKTKEELHDTLKTLNYVKITANQIQKQNNLLKVSLSHKQHQILSLKNQLNTIKSQHANKLQEINSKHKIKIEAELTRIQKLKAENIDLISKNDQLITDRLSMLQIQSQQIITQQHCKDHSLIFQEQRSHFKSEIQRLKSQLEDLNNQLNKQKQAAQVFQSQLQHLQIKTSKRERQFLKQITDFKKMHSEAKKVYYNTFDTLRQNQIISKQLLGYNTQQQQKQNMKLKPIDNNADIKSNNQQSQINKYIQKIALAQDALLNCQSQLNSQKAHSQRLAEEVTRLSIQLQHTIIDAHQREHKERCLYENQINKLLKNIQKRKN